MRNVTTTLWLLYRSTHASWVPQLRTGDSVKVLPPSSSCRWQLAHSDYGEDARVLLNGWDDIIKLSSAHSLSLCFIIQCLYLISSIINK